MSDTKDVVLWHPAFAGGIELSLREYKKDLEYEREHLINKGSIRADVLVVKKNPGVKIEKSIGAVFRGHNIVEIKGLNDKLNIDVLNKLIAYTALYKSHGETVNSIPGEELTASTFRREFPREMFKEAEKLGGKVTNPYPGIYYVAGLVYFPVQVIVCSRLDPKEYPELTMLREGVTLKELEAYISHKFDDQGDQINAAAVVEAVLGANPGLLAKIKEDDAMSKELEEFLQPRIEEEKQKIAVRMLKKNFSLDQIKEITELSMEVIQSLAKSLGMPVTA